MAYTPKTWVCGETITAEDLNHLENGLADCCGGDCGYECTETKTLITVESVTTSAQSGMNMGEFSYSQLIDADEITVTFNGTEYTAEKNDFDGSFIYGGFSATGPDFSEYPFAIASNASDGNMLFTETVGTYSIKIESYDIEINSVTNCFKKAVEEVSGNANFLITASAYVGDDTQRSNDSLVSIDASYSDITLDKSYQEIAKAFSSGKNCIMILNSDAILRLNCIERSNYGPVFMFNATRLTETRIMPGGTIIYGVGTIQISVGANEISGHSTAIRPLFT